MCSHFWGTQPIFFCLDQAWKEMHPMAQHMFDWYIPADCKKYNLTEGNMTWFQLGVSKRFIHVFMIPYHVQGKSGNPLANHIKFMFHLNWGQIQGKLNLEMIVKHIPEEIFTSEMGEMIEIHLIAPLLQVRRKICHIQGLVSEAPCGIISKQDRLTLWE